jgi:hypothetical protein
MRTVRKGWCRRPEPTTEENAARDEIAIAELDQRYASLRLVAPDELGRVRASIERMGILSPVGHAPHATPGGSRDRRAAP